jgi:hypothetical protein
MVFDVRAKAMREAQAATSARIATTRQRRHFVCFGGNLPVYFEPSLDANLTL